MPDENPPVTADVAKLAKLVVALAERLRVWREAEAAKAAVLKAAGEALHEEAADWVDACGDADLLAA